MENRKESSVATSRLPILPNGSVIACGKAVSSCSVFPLLSAKVPSQPRLEGPEEVELLIGSVASFGITGTTAVLMMVFP